MKYYLVIAIFAILALNNAILCSDKDIEMRIYFVDDPTIKNSWWPWVKESLRLEIALCNYMDSTIALQYLTPCYDCNPKFFLEEVNTGIKPNRTSELDVLYVLSDESFFNLKSGKCHADTIDVLEYIEYNFKKNHKYRIWLEYQANQIFNYQDSTGKHPIWREIVVSDTLVFKYD